MIQITEHKIDTDAVLAAVSDENSGASVLFLGTTRAWTGGQFTSKLEYTAHHEMAIKTMTELAARAKDKWPVTNVAIVHRTGTVAIGEASVAIAVSSPHRAAAFDAAEWLIDNLKAEVPIWKKDFADASVDAGQWIHPENES